MVGIAELLLNQGYKISGSDLSQSKNTLRLKKLGATIKLGHAKENIKKADVVVFSSAVNKTNPEITEAKKSEVKQLRDIVVANEHKNSELAFESYEKALSLLN